MRARQARSNIVRVARGMAPMTQARGQRARGRNRLRNRRMATPVLPPVAGNNVVTTGRRGMFLSDCARRYLESLNSPFSGILSCVPSEFNFPTLKHFFRVSGTCVTGTTLVGFVSFNPWQGVFIPGAANNYPIQSSNTSFALQTFANAPTTGVLTAPTNTPYLSNLTDVQFQFRVVAGGLRVRNITPLLNKGGSLVGIESLNHDDLNGESINSCLQQDTASRMDPLSEDWSSVVFHPENPEEINFYNVTNQPVNKFLGFIFNAPVPQEYEFEAAVICEVKGNVIHGLTPSESDPHGFAAVQNLTSNSAARRPFKTSDSGFRLGNLLGGLAKTFLPQIGNIASIASQVTSGVGRARLANAALRAMPLLTGA